MMNSAQENKYTVPFFDYNSIISNVLLSKQQSLEQQMEIISKNIDDFNFKMNTFIEDRYNYDKFNHMSYQKSMKNNEQNNILNNIMNEVSKLNNIDDIQDQVAVCAYACRSIFELLKNMKQLSEDNYNKNLLHLFYQAIKRNYSKGLFTSTQIHIMLDIIKECKKSFVPENVYWEFDEKLYECGLAVFPEEG